MTSVPPVESNDRGDPRARRRVDQVRSYVSRVLAYQSLGSVHPDTRVMGVVGGANKYGDARIAGEVFDALSLRL